MFGGWSPVRRAHLRGLVALAVTRPRPSVQVVADRQGIEPRAGVPACDVEADPRVREAEERFELSEKLASQHRMQGLRGDEAFLEQDFARELVG